MRFGWGGFLLLIGCSSADSFPPVADPPAAAPLAGFASDTVLVVSSEDAADSFTLLSLDTASGEVGLLPGSPADVGVRISDAETLAADVPRRRVFYGSNLDGRIAVLEVDATGAATPVPGSPFAAERPGVSVIKVAPSGDSIYVGYHDASLLSRYAVDGAGALTLAQSISTGANSHVETMLQVGDVLYVGFQNPSVIVGYRLEVDEAFAAGPVVAVTMPVNTRPDFLAAHADKLYCSLANDASVDAFTVETDGTLTRLAGAPYAFPGLELFELIAIPPGGGVLAVGAEIPTAAVGLYTIAADGTLAPSGAPVVLHERKGGPEGMAFSADGRFLYVCDHVGQGLYVFEVTGGSIAFAATPRYALPGRQIDVLRLPLAVVP